MTKNHYEVLAGNIGYVHRGTNKKSATKEFVDYKRRSIQGVGRGAGCGVILFQNNEPIRQYLGKMGEMTE